MTGWSCLEWRFCPPGRSWSGVVETLDCESTARTCCRLWSLVFKLGLILNGHITLFGVLKPPTSHLSESPFAVHASPSYP